MDVITTTGKMNSQNTKKESILELLNECLSKGRKECCKLHGSVCKLRSGQAVLMGRRDRAKKDLKTYVETLSKALLEFESDMLFTITKMFTAKYEDMEKSCEKCEEKTKLYLKLCSDAEKITQFGHELETLEDKKTAIDIIHSFKKLFDSTDELLFDETLKLEFYPALNNAEIRPPMFGDLVVGSTYKSTDCRLSDLRARDCNPNIPSGSQSEQKSVTSCEVSTQTIDINDSLTKPGDQNKYFNANQTSTNTLQSSEPNSRGKTITPPPGIGEENIPCTFQSSNITNPSQYSNVVMPPPGFNVCSPATNMGINFQMSQPVFVAQYPSIQAQSYFGQFQVPLNYQFGGVPFTNGYRFQAQPQPSVSIPNSSARSVTTSNKKTTGTNISKKDNRVQNIPLPPGLAPKQTAPLEKDIASSCGTLISTVNSTLPPSENEKVNSSSLIRDNEGSDQTRSLINAKSKSPLNCSIEKSVEKISSDTGNKTAHAKSKWDFIVEASNGKRKVITGTDIEKRKKQSENDMLEAIEKQTKELNLGEDNDEIDFIQRTDESEIVVEHVKKGPDNICEKRNGGKTESGFGDSTILSNVNEMKKRLGERKFVRLPLKPLRKPLHETNVLLNIFPSPDKNNNNIATNGTDNVITTAEKPAEVGEDKTSKTAASDKDISDSGTWDAAPVKESLIENVSDTLSPEQVKLKTEPNEDFLLKVKQEPIDEWNDSYELSKSINSSVKKTLFSANKTVDKEHVVIKKEIEIKKEMVDDVVDQDGEKENEFTSARSVDHVNGKKNESTPSKEADKVDTKKKETPLASSIKPSGARLDTPSKRQSSQSLSERLGALQSHWIGKKHTNMKAKHLYTCSQGMKYPIGITTNTKGDIIIADTGNHVVKMFDCQGNFVKTFDKKMTPPFRRPSAVVVNEYDYVYVKDDYCIRIFDKNGQYVKSVGAHLFSQPYGLAITPARCLLVLDTDRRYPQLIHLTQDGLQDWRYLYTPLTMAPQASKCRFLAVSENNVFVSDLGLSSVYITTFKGIFIRTIGWPGAGLQQFNEPSGITADIYGNVVIADSKNDRVQVYRHDGSYTGVIDFDTRLTRPSGIHLTNNNKLLIVNFLNHNVKVFELYPA